MPTPVIHALKTHIDLEARIGGYEAAAAADEKVQATYSAVARMLNCRSTEVAIVENATRGWDMAFYAFDFRAGDRIRANVQLLEVPDGTVLWSHSPQVGMRDVFELKEKRGFMEPPGIGIS